MSGFLERALALVVYRRWFYAPHHTARQCVDRLRWLGFVWDGRQWTAPPVDLFLRRIAGKP